MISALAKLYGKIIDIRNSRYDSGKFASHSLGALTISVGNITVGGTGKTPVVAYVAELLADSGEKVCVISRGYKRDNEAKRVPVSDFDRVLAGAKEGGDEPRELAGRLLGKAIVIADRDRVSAGKWAKEEFGITAFVLDDAFQHRKVRRDLDIVVIDGMNPFGNRQTLPAGILREPLENLERADVIIVSRSNLASDLEDTLDEIQHYSRRADVFRAETKTHRILELSAFIDGKVDASDVKPGIPFAFCGIGNPENFFAQLRADGWSLKAEKRYRDHHSYTERDLADLEKLAIEEEAEVLLTTAKDAVKLADFELTLPCYVVESQLSFPDEKKLRRIIHAVFDQKSARF